jgi:hypothetical protein
VLTKLVVRFHCKIYVSLRFCNTQIFHDTQNIITVKIVALYGRFLCIKCLNCATSTIEVVSSKIVTRVNHLLYIYMN